MTNRSSRPVATTSGQSGELSATVIVLMVLGVTGVSMSGPIMAGAVGVPALAIAFWRNTLGAASVAPFAWATARHELSRFNRGQWQLCLLAGAMLAAHFATWASSLRLTSVASATALVSLQVAWVVVITRMLGQRTGRHVWLGVGVALIGVVVISGVDLTVSADALTGDALAVAGGVFAAVYTIVGARVRETVTTTAYTFVAYSISGLLLLACCAVGRQQIVGYSAQNWGLILAVTVAAQLLGHSVFNHLLATVSPTVVSMTLLLEVPGAALLAAVFLGQAPPAGVFVGLLCILAGLAVVVTARTTTPAEAPID